MQGDVGRYRGDIGDLVLRSEMHTPAVRPPLTRTGAMLPLTPARARAVSPPGARVGASPHISLSPRQAHEWVQDGCYVVLMPKAAIKRSGLTPVTDPATELIQAATPPCNPSQPALQP